MGVSDWLSSSDGGAVGLGRFLELGILFLLELTLMLIMLGSWSDSLRYCIALHYSLIVLEILLRTLEPIISLRVRIQISTSILHICLVLLQILLSFNFFLWYLIDISISDQNLVVDRWLLFYTTHPKTKLVVFDRISRCCLLMVCSWSFVKVISIYVSVQSGSLIWCLVLGRCLVNVHTELCIVWDKSWKRLLLLIDP